MADDEKRAGCVGKHEENVERAMPKSNIELNGCHPERSEAKSKDPVERPSVCNGALGFARDDVLPLDVFFLIG